MSVSEIHKSRSGQATATYLQSNREAEIMPLDILPRLLRSLVRIDDIDHNRACIGRLVSTLLVSINSTVAEKLPRNTLIIMPHRSRNHIVHSERVLGANDKASLGSELLVRQSVDERLAVAGELPAVAAEEFGVVLALVSFLVGVGGQHGEEDAALLLLRPGARVALPAGLEQAEVEEVVDRGRVVGLQAAGFEVPPRLLVFGDFALGDVQGQV